MNARLVLRGRNDFPKSKLVNTDCSHCVSCLGLLYDAADSAAAVVSPLCGSERFSRDSQLRRCGVKSAFALIGIWGLAFLQQAHSRSYAGTFIDKREQWPYLFIFVGLLLTAFGSSYYHLAPDNARLLWDRLPMTIAFMAMVSAVIAERINVRLGIWLLPILLSIGLTSVLQWEWSETRGSGDLRFYAAIQAYSALVVLLAFLFPRRYTRTADFGLVIGFYALAKALETFDKLVFAALHIVSGHTLKHLAAAAAGYCIFESCKSDSRLRPHLPFKLGIAIGCELMKLFEDSADSAEWHSKAAITQKSSLGGRIGTCCLSGGETVIINLV
jgi:hypothetical protein